MSMTQNSAQTFTDWLTKHWVGAALVGSLILFAATPLLTRVFSGPLLLIYLHCPIYMLHQVEEHWGDRFRTFVNQRLFGGVEALTPESVLWINIPGVWGVNVIALLAGWRFGLGLSVIAPYLMLVNAVGHFAMAFETRSYNPGLWTGAALLLPMSLYTLRRIALIHGATRLQHIIGLGCTLAIHFAIAAHIRARAQQAGRLLQVE
jgi:hypothetical protein